MSALVLMLAAAAAAEAGPICTDRPTKANALCTVPVGRLQLETSAASWSLTKSPGARTELLTVGSSFIKVGLSGRSDLQVGIMPYAELTTKQGGTRSRTSGFDDLVVRYKHRLTNSSAKIQVGVIPFIKLPTAKHDIGNGKVEGGLAVPISVATGSPITLVLGPEADLLADSDGDGRHPALVNLINLSEPIADRVTLYGELWTMTNFDPADTVTLASADAAISYALRPNFQVDVGANLGLTRHTADAELYLGLSVRF